MTLVAPRLAVDEIFSHALRGEPCYLVAPGLGRSRLPVQDWNRSADGGDQRLLELCVGATLDVGCGPGRLTAELAARGHITMGVDIVDESIGQTRERGGTALQRDIFHHVPGEGRWRTALLADGNIGIGGNPIRLLDRIRRILSPGGIVVIEVEPSETTTATLQAYLECACGQSPPFGWAVVSIQDLPGIAARAGLRVAHRSSCGTRQFAVLQEALE